jgi:hypothetical protein
MLDDATRQPPPETPASRPADPAPEPPQKFDIGEEFGTAKRNLPPPKVLLIGLILVLAVAVIVVFSASRPKGSASIDNVTAVEIPNQNSVLVAINVTVHNASDKAMWIHSMKASAQTDSSEPSDDAAAPIDFERYFQAFPALKEHAIAPLTVETKIAPNSDAQGTIIVSFPLTLSAFNARKSLTVTIQPYDQRPLEIKKQGA